MRVLITGVAGFAGGHLAKFLSGKKGIELHGVLRPHSERDASFLKHVGIQLHSCDLREAKKVRSLLEKTKPDRIFHLAAQASVPVSWQFPKESMVTNIFGTLNLFESARELKLDPLIQIAGSSQEYGIPGSNLKSLDETTPLKPLSPYAVSKIAQDYLAYQYFLSLKTRVVRTRGFNYTGPGQSENFVVSSLARQVALIEAGKMKPELCVGNLEAVRDFTDVRDMVRAYWLALEKGEVGDIYNICTGAGHRIGEILDVYLSLSSEKIEIKNDLSRMRAADIPRLVGNPAKFMKQTGWKPEIPLKKTLTDLLRDWRERVRNIPKKSRG